MANYNTALLKKQMPKKALKELFAKNRVAFKGNLGTQTHKSAKEYRRLKSVRDYEM